MDRKIIAVHLYNDYSGSPRVLASNLQFLQKRGFDITIHTSEQEGRLSSLPGIPIHPFSYAPANNKYLQLWNFLRVQFLLFIRLFFSLSKGDLIYINTLLPFGAAIAARLRCCKVVYHIHETSIQPRLLKQVLKWVAKYTAHRLVYVSDFLRQVEPTNAARSVVIHNSLSQDFIEASKQAKTPMLTKQNFTCLMACSLRQYKGVDQYVTLARSMPNYRFELVLNAREQDISTYFAGQEIPENLVVFPQQKDMHWFYHRADLVLNLSLPDQWLETFGMTILEGMHYGLPVIGPPAGGPAELIEHRRSGFTTSAYKLEMVQQHIKCLAEDHSIYQTFSQNAQERAAMFSEEQATFQWLDLIQELAASKKANDTSKFRCPELI